MTFSSLLLIAFSGTMCFAMYQAIASPDRARTFETSTAGEGGYYLALCFFIGTVPASVIWTFVTVDDRSPLYAAVTIWMLVCGGWGLLGILLPFPILKWFVPPAYRTATEHIYPRPVIGLKRVKYLTYPPDGD